MQPTTDLDLTEKMDNLAASFLNSLDEVDRLILKRGSPISGFKNVKIYTKVKKPSLIGKGPGFFGEAVVKKFPNLTIENELR